MRQQIEKTYCDRCGDETHIKTVTQRSAMGATQNDPASGRTEYETDIMDICHSCAIVLLQRVINTGNNETTFPARSWVHKPRTEFH